MFEQLKKRFRGPAPVERSPQEQKAVARDCKELVLYQFPSCPFCRLVRNRIRQLDLPIAEKNIQRDPEALHELMEGGGRRTVPCLRIDEAGGRRWMYESGDIIRYLDKRFSG